MDNAEEQLSEEQLEDLGQQAYSVWDDTSEMTPWGELPSHLRDRYRRLGGFFHEKYSEKFSEDIEFAEQALAITEDNAADLSRELDAARGLSAKYAQSVLDTQAMFERSNKHNGWLAMLLMLTWTAGIVGILFWPFPWDRPGAESSATPTVSSNEDGYVVISDDGVPTRVPWPDVGDYPAERFTADCHAVCETPDRYARPGEPEGRVMVIDPEHLTCICFRSGSSWPITRYVGWTAVR